jgi:hypothetical protein
MYTNSCLEPLRLIIRHAGNIATIEGPRMLSRGDGKHQENILQR